MKGKNQWTVTRHTTMADKKKAMESRKTQNDDRQDTPMNSRKTHNEDRQQKQIGRSQDTER